MEQLGILLAHLVGDYLLQNDWMASNKGVLPPKRPTPSPTPPFPAYHESYLEAAMKREAGQVADASALGEWRRGRDAAAKGWAACVVHCALYTLAVWMFCWPWMPAWGYLACFAAHYAIDRYGLARHWMTRVSGQSAFAHPRHPCWPWSIIVVDNTFHLLTLYLIAKAQGL